ncbi:hypothetical protein H310_05706 [Aphanomyces invadans]|uniref:Uncharacterized protein n=1 Tax=Aphanomyces invadans TaxID=157072 RepID=A0A024U909_9STRA|nr:hypothetical protein H310_05706 [Aphanomyces invadans]ETW02103.1 hypothetical protein H310_05706 [Aphanomyces invadans]|eukprot:XP_008868708.1 hypothetical protein H310_05706 [Aphanomyces invadans]
MRHSFHSSSAFPFHEKTAYVELENNGARAGPTESMSAHAKRESVHKEVSWEHVLAEVLRANEEPDNTDLTVLTAVRRAKERVYVQSQFQRCQEQVRMDPNLLFFSEPYEKQYMAFMNVVNRFRVRLCFSIGASACGLLYWHEAFVLKAFAASSTGIDENAQAALYVVCFGVIVPTFALGVLMSFIPWGRDRLESIASIVYVVVAMALITKKCIQQAKGPIYPLVILLIPLFNVTRMRFAYTSVVGAFIVVVFFIVQLAAGPDPTSTVVFTTLNYSMSVIGGMVSSYQKELLKRRNFTLGLNFSGAEDDASSRIHSPYYAKEVVCYRWTQAFRHADLERRFYRYWYLIDGSPYENPNAGVLHSGVYLGWRFAAAGMCLNQVVLVLQDVINLYKTSTHYIALGFRVGCIIPAYMILFGCMYYFCRAYAKGWIAHRMLAPPSRGATPPSTTVSIAVRSRASIQHHASLAVNRVHNDLVGVHHGYTHTMQAITAAVILFHVYLTGTLVYVIAVNIGVKGVYFMGFLNATLVAHRSSFRLRFVYSSVLTMVACLAFLFGTRNVLPRQTHLEYTCYLGVVQILGMIVSYEEENLRRSFFLKKSLRALEFKAWLNSVLRVQSWVRARMIRKTRDAKCRLKAPREAIPEDNVEEPSRVATRASTNEVPTSPVSAIDMRTASSRVIPVGKFSLPNLAAPLADMDLNKNLRDLQSKLADVDLNKNLRDLQSKLAVDVDLNKNLRDLQGKLNKNNEVVTNASSRMSKASRFGMYSTCVSVLIAFGQVMFFLAKQK